MAKMPEDKTAGRVECQNEILTAGFVQTPIIMLRDQRLTAGAKLVYGGLLWYLWRGGAYPGQVVMAEEFGVGERSVRRYLSELKQHGYLTVKRHGLGQPNTYTLLCPWEQSPDRPIWPVKAASMADQGGQSGRSLEVRDSTTHTEEQQQQQAPADPQGSANRTAVVASSMALTTKDLTDRIAELGVAKSTAKKLLKEHDPSIVYRWVCYAAHKLQTGWVPKESPAAWIVSAIRSEDWVIPDWFQTPEEKAEAKAAKQRVAEEERRSREQAADQERQAAEAQRRALEEGLGIGEEARELWDRTRELLQERGQMTPALFSAYLLPLRDGAAAIATPVEFFVEVIEQHAADIRAALEDTTEHTVERIEVRLVQAT
jgi:hypothetical protein